MTYSAEPIALDLFGQVDKYSDDIIKGVLADDMAIDNTPIYVFYYNFFLQFFENVVHDEQIRGFDQEARNQADRLRLTLDGPQQAPVRQVIAQFDDFCILREDLGGGLYFTPDGDDFTKFHHDYIPRLLQSIEAWAASASLPALAQRAGQALDRYNSALAHLR